MKELLYFLIVPVVYCQLWIQPQQIHLSYSDDPSEMVVTWATDSENNESLVEYGLSMGDLSHTSSGRVIKFHHTPNSSHYSWIHRSVMTELKPSKRYYYHVGGMSGWSAVYTFIAKPVDATWSPTIAIYGDMGNVNGKALGYLQKEAQTGGFDFILHIGDFAYDLFDSDGYIGDAFMQQIEPIAGYIPYMTCPGNHEAMYNFAHYKNRFTMPGGDNMLYRMVAGRAQVISISTEVFYNNEQSEEDLKLQFIRLQKILQDANKQRDKYPWLIVIGHRPMYCSNNDGLEEHCNNPFNPVRVGTNYTTRQYSLEDLFYKAGVDLQFYAHEHSYERDWPVYDTFVCNGTKGPYMDPGAPVHIVTGSAGDREGQTTFDPVEYPWTASYTDDYGYTKIKIYNATHLYLEQISTDKQGAVIDNMWLVKHTHGPGTYDCHLHGRPKAWPKPRPVKSAPKQPSVTSL